MQKGVNDIFRSEEQTRATPNIPATSHSCQVWGISAPWHASNPSCLRLCPPASSQLISGDTSHRPDKESFYPENNPSHLPPQCKAVPHFLLYFLHCSCYPLSPIYTFPITFCGLLSFFHVSICLCQIIYTSCFISLNLLSVFSTPSSLRLQVSFLCWWVSLNRCCDCQLRNSLRFL